jgi:hypothetical protein
MAKLPSPDGVGAGAGVCVGGAAGGGGAFSGGGVLVPFLGGGVWLLVLPLPPFFEEPAGDAIGAARAMVRQVTIATAKSWFFKVWVIFGSIPYGFTTIGLGII